MRLSITKTMALGIVVLQIVTVCIILLSSYFTTEQVLLGHAQQLMRNLSREVIHRSEEFLSPARSAVNLTQSLAKHRVVSSERPNDMEHYFYEQLMLYPHIAGIYYGNLDGDFYFVRRSSEVADFQIKRITEDAGERRVWNRWYNNGFLLTQEGYDPEDRYDPRTRPWFTKAIGEKGQIWTDPYLFFTSQTPGITVASPVFSKSGDMMGVVGVDIDLSALSDFLGQLELSEKASALIMNNNGDVVAHRSLKGAYIEDKSSGIKRLLRVDELEQRESRAAVESLQLSPGWYVLNTAVNSSFEYDGEMYQAVFTPFSDNWPWLLGIYIPEEDFLTEIKANQHFNMVLAACVTLMSVLLGVWFARSLSRPILDIQKGVQSVRRGELEVDIDSRGSIFNDIAETSEAFSKMLSALKENQLQGDQLKAELARQTRFMEAALANIDDGVVACDADGKMIFSNRAVMKLRGLPENARLERFDDAPFRVYAADGLTLLEKSQWPIFRALNGDEVSNLEVVVVAACGEKHRVKVSGSALFDNDGEKIGAVVAMHRVSFS